MTPSLLDHSYVVLVFVVFPLYARLSYPRLVKELREGGEAARILAYQRTILTWFLFGAGVVLLWWSSGRSWADLGINAGQLDRQLIAAAIALIAIVVFAIPLRNALQSGQVKQLVDGLEEVFVLMPGAGKDLHWFRAVSLNAGFTEELVFRGYLIWYLSQYVSVWPAAIAAVILFGYGHLYQGLKQLPGIMLVAAIAVGLFVYTESLLIPIIYHALHDVVQGHYLAKFRQSLAEQPAAERE